VPQARPEGTQGDMSEAGESGAASGPAGFPISSEQSGVESGPTSPITMWHPAPSCLLSSRSSLSGRTDRGGSERRTGRPGWIMTENVPEKQSQLIVLFARNDDLVSLGRWLRGNVPAPGTWKRADQPSPSAADCPRSLVGSASALNKLLFFRAPYRFGNFC
jgi:hypothetical protein